MLIMRFTILVILLFFFSHVNASVCEDLQPNTNTLLTTTSNTKCVTFKNVNIHDTYLVSDADLREAASYRVKISSPTSSNLLDRSISPSDVSFQTKVNTQYNTELTITISPQTNGRDYDFYIAHDENTLLNETTIYIGLYSKDILNSIQPPQNGGWQPDTPVNPPENPSPLTPPPPPGADCDFTNPNGPDFAYCQPVGGLSTLTTPLRFPSLILSANSLTTTTSNSNDTEREAIQCSAENRPPQKAPTHRDTGEQLNVNNVLRVSEQWAQQAELELTNNAFKTAALLRLKVMHEVGGALDAAHGDNPDYPGTFEMGNFLYGANGSAMGFTEDTLISGGAAFTPIGQQGWTFSSIAEGVYNYFFGSDNQGDTDEVIQGIKYYNEVFANNRTDERSFSCLDVETINSAQNDTTPPSGSGGGGGYGNDPIGGVGGGGFGGGIGLIGGVPDPVCYRELPDGNGGTYILIVDCPDG